MATIQTDGLTPVTVTSTDNNGGTVRANGRSSGTFANIAINRPSSSVFGSTPVDNDDADKAFAGESNEGVFAYNNLRPIAKKVTRSLSTVDNTYLLSGAADTGYRQSIHKIDYIRTRKLTTAIRDNKWNQYSGDFDPGYPETSLDIFYNISADSISTLPVDDAALSSRVKPGELTYMGGSPNPVTKVYPEKTS